MADNAFDSEPTKLPDGIIDIEFKEKSYQTFLFERGKKLFGDSGPQAYMQNDLNRMLEDGYITKQQIVTSIYGFTEMVDIMVDKIKADHTARIKEIEVWKQEVESFLEGFR